MSQSEFARTVGILALLGVLVSTFVLYGAGVARYGGPPYDKETVINDPGRTIGETVEFEGTVSQSGPVVVGIEVDGERHQVRVANAPDVEPGDVLVLVGTVQSDGVIDANRNRSIVLDPWELQYLYAISVLGAVLVAARIANQWRFDRGRLYFEPREQTLLQQHRRRERQGGRTDG